MDTAEGGQQAVPAPVDDRDWGHLVGVSIPPLVLSSTEGRSIWLRWPPTASCSTSTLGQAAQASPDAWLGQGPGGFGLYGPIMRLPRLPFGSHRRGREGRGALDPAAPRAGWFRERNDIPFRLISDPDLRLADSLGLPTFEFTGQFLQAGDTRRRTRRDRQGLLPSPDTGGERGSGAHTAEGSVLTERISWVAI
jgi:hypothetical protein